MDYALFPKEFLHVRDTWLSCLLWPLLETLGSSKLSDKGVWLVRRHVEGDKHTNATLGLGFSAKLMIQV